MPHHFTKATVEASVWCTTCAKMTPWRIADGRRQYCIPCYRRGEMGAKPAAEPSAEQIGLFEGGAR